MRDRRERFDGELVVLGALLRWIAGDDAGEEGFGAEPSATAEVRRARKVGRSGRREEGVFKRWKT